MDWAAVVCEKGRPVTSNLETFIQTFKTVFDHPDRGQSSSQQLLQLSQGTGSVADYAIHFHILVADCILNEAALLTVFRLGLSAELQLVLACRDAGRDLDEVIELAIKLDQQMRGKGRRSSIIPCHSSFVPSTRGQPRSESEEA